MNADFNRVEGKFGVLSGSPKKVPKGGQDQFKSSTAFSMKPVETGGRQEQKLIPDRKTKDLVGSDPIT
jgi:hypothetical protein